jgi:hypothetical protein
LLEKYLTDISFYH